MSAVAARKKTPPAPLEYLRQWPLRLWLAAMGVFVYLPLVVLVVFSFNDSKRNVVWKGFTLNYYDMTLHDSGLLEAFGNSLTIALISTLVSLVFGALAAVAFWRFRFPFKGAVEGLFALPIIAPEICLGVALLVFFAKVAPWPKGLIWPFNLGAIIIAHIAFSFPFVAVVIRARLASFNRELEEAARDLGATQVQTFFDVLAPHMQPGLISGGLLAFTLSLDDFVITFFTSGPDTSTFPVKVYSMVRFSVTPEVNAASTLLILVTVILTAIAMRLQGPDGAKESLG